MKSKQWPNKLGWNVGRYASVIDLGRRGFGVLITSASGPLSRYMVIKRDQFIDPLSAVELCRRKGYRYDRTGET